MTQQKIDWKHWTTFTILGTSMYYFIHKYSYAVFSNHFTRDTALKLITGGIT